MRRRTVIALSFGIAALATVPLIYAGVSRIGGEAGCPIGRLHGGGHGHGMMKFHALKSELNLTDQQEKALHEIFLRTREQNKGTKQALKNGLHDAAEVLLANPNNVEGARAAMARNDAALEQLRTSVLASVSEGLQVLTPQQRQKAAAWFAEHHRSE